MEVLNSNKVRLEESILAFFKEGIAQIAPEAELYVFGSRADLNKKGGDIDLLILTTEKIPTEALRQLKYSFWHQFGEQKVDLVNFTFEDDKPFKRIALASGIKI